MISWKVRSRTRVVSGRGTQKVACFVVWTTVSSHPFLGPPGAGKRFSSANHIHSTLIDILKLSRRWRRGTNMTTYKSERWSRDHWRVDNLTMTSTWKSLAKGLSRLTMDSHVHSRQFIQQQCPQVGCSVSCVCHTGWMSFWKTLDRQPSP
jgi:hypothetical protein